MSAPTSSTSSAHAVRGRVEPRLWTPPLRDLSEPGASRGPLWIEFAERVLRSPFDPWQRWLALHAGELLPDGRPRFWLVLVLVARQNGKTAMPERLAPYATLMDEAPMVLGTSTKLDYAKDTFMKSVRLMERAAAPGGPLEGRIPDARRKWVRQANGEVGWYLGDPSNPLQYKIAPADAEGGRSLTTNLLILDELRQHRSRDAWNASVPTTEAVPDAQVWALSNAGDDSSVVLNAERDAALRTLQTGDGDQRVGIFEWSAPEDADPLDPEAQAMANPQLGYRIDGERFMGKARSAVAEGGESLAGFLTESLCIRVKVMDPAIDPGSWERCRDPGSLARLRSRLALCLDVSPDGGHATVYAAATLADGRVRVDPVEDWSGRGAVSRAERALPGLLAKVKPRRLAWFPGGPGAALAAAVKDRGHASWPPPGVQVEEIKAEVAAVCMGFESLVVSGQLAHSGDPLLDAQVAQAERLRTGSRWVFGRGSEANVDAVYAAAGAVHLARTMPAPLQVQSVLTV